MLQEENNQVEHVLHKQPAEILHLNYLSTHMYLHDIFKKQDLEEKASPHLPDLVQTLTTQAQKGEVENHFGSVPITIKALFPITIKVK